jgi:hypothetical protein
VTAVGKLFVIVSVFAALVVPTFCIPKLRLEGVSETAASPVPLRDIVIELLTILPR